MVAKSKRPTEEEKRDAAHKALSLLSLREKDKGINEEIERLTRELRTFVGRYFTGLTPKGHKRWTYNKMVRVTLEDVPRYSVSVSRLIGKINIEEAADYLRVDRTKLVAAIQAKKVNLTPKQLEAISSKRKGATRVRVSYINPKLGRILRRSRKRAASTRAKTP